MSLLIFIIAIIITFIISRLYGVKQRNKNYLEDELIEFFWTTIPILFIIGIAIPSIRILYLLEENFSPTFTVKIIRNQWFWQYEYSFIKNFNIDSFLKSHEDLEEGEPFLKEVSEKLALPVNCYIRFIITSNDVIHSWSLPAIGLKMDAVPGRLNQVTT